jgi:hypothetical protein
MNNVDEELTYLERVVVDNAKKRYRRRIYRYGFLILCLIVPMMTVALFVPMARPFREGLASGVVVVMLISQSITSTRIIGKLTATMGGARNI